MTALYQDSDLLKRMAQNDHKAFEEIWLKYWEQVYNTAYKRLQDEDLCKDLVQELFINFWERRNTLSINNLPGYFANATRYKVFKVLAKEKTNTPFYKALDPIVNCAVEANNLVVEKELKALAEAWLQTLPGKRKEIFLLYYRENLSTKEIAERLGITQKTVQNQINTASNELRNKILMTLLITASIG